MSRGQPCCRRIPAICLLALALALAGLAVWRASRIAAVSPATTAPDATTAPASPAAATDTPAVPATASPVQGDIVIEGGRSAAGGVAGDTISLHIAYPATSSAGPVTHMRVSSSRWAVARAWTSATGPGNRGHRRRC